VVLSLMGAGMGDWVLARSATGLGFVLGLAPLAVGVVLVSRPQRTA